jgi:nitric oxide reductase activation protein
MRQTLRSALPIVAAALGHKLGVAVRVGGADGAKTDGGVIVLPDLPENDPVLRTVTWGYLAHEAAHVRHTDFAAYARGAEDGPLQAALQNIFEDIRIEQALAVPYPGTRASIAAVLRHLLATGDLSAAAATDHPARVLTGYLLLALRHRVLGQAVLAKEAQKAAASLGQVFDAPFVQQLETLLRAVPTLPNTAAVVALARRVHALLTDALRAPEAPQPPLAVTSRDSREAADEADATRSGNTIAQTDAPAPGEANDTSPAEADRSNSAAATDGDAAPEPAVQSEATDGTAPAQSDHDAPEGAAKTAAIRAVLSAGAGDCAVDPFRAAAALLERSATDHTVRLPSADDVGADPALGRDLLARVRAESARLTARLLGLVQASRQDRPRSARHGRRLAPNRLHRVAVGDDRLFLRRQRRVAPDTAVHLLVDLSGSMARGVPVGTQRVSAARVAQESALALALALDAIPGVAVAVTAFPGVAGQEAILARLVRHGQPPRTRAGAFAQLPRGGTPLAGALWYAAADLLACDAQRRLVLVLTDGRPDDRPGAQRILALCREAGIETIGVGIAIDVGALFPTAVTVHALGELRQALFTLAERLRLGVAA